jgi:hypothetical protein
MAISNTTYYEAVVHGNPIRPNTEVGPDGLSCADLPRLRVRRNADLRHTFAPRNRQQQISVTTPT